MVMKDDLDMVTLISLALITAFGVAASVFFVHGWYLMVEKEHRAMISGPPEALVQYRAEQEKKLTGIKVAMKATVAELGAN